MAAYTHGDDIPVGMRLCSWRCKDKESGKYMIYPRDEMVTVENARTGITSDIVCKRCFDKRKDEFNCCCICDSCVCKIDYDLYYQYDEERKVCYACLLVNLNYDQHELKNRLNSREKIEDSSELKELAHDLIKYKQMQNEIAKDDMKQDAMCVIKHYFHAFYHREIHILLDVLPRDRLEKIAALKEEIHTRSFAMSSTKIICAIAGIDHDKVKNHPRSKY
jgi:hypothetical protein